ncbi:MAG: opacity protein-like surface antigen [Chlamydiales bacterium]|jgi:opacity protein-like surface antigen
MSTRVRIFLGLGIALAGCSAPSATIQNPAPGVGHNGVVERTYTLSIHGIANSQMDLSGSVSSIPVAGTDAGLQGYTVEAATIGKRINWLVGYSDRTLEEGVNFVEINGGAMLHLRSRGTWIPYLIGTLRYSQGLDFPTSPASTSADFFGWAGGVGVRHHSTDRFFLDLRITYEGVLEDIDAGLTRNLNMQGLLATIGAGFSF